MSDVRDIFEASQRPEMKVYERESRSQRAGTRIGLHLYSIGGKLKGGSEGGDPTAAGHRGQNPIERTHKTVALNVATSRSRF
jgi:hypothetical protein